MKQRRMKMIRASDYTKFISEVITEDGYEVDKKEAFSKLGEELKLNNFVRDGLETLFDEMILQYAILKFRTIPIDNDNNPVHNIFLNGVTRELSFHAYLISKININFEYDGLSSSANHIGTTNESNTGTVRKDKNKTDTITKNITSNSTNNGMTEESPINATIGDINTPAFKSVGVTTGEGTENNSVTVVDNTTDTLNTNVNISNSSSDKNPEIFMKYVQALKETDIYKIMHHCINRFIYEFNMVF